MSRRASSTHDEFSDAQDFVETLRPKYEALVRAIKHVCQEVAEEVGPAVVKNIYSRGDKQPYGELKATHKLPKALRKEKEAKRKRGDNSATTFRDIGDLVGVTVVVQYPDQVNPIAERVATRLKRRNKLKRLSKGLKTDLGYYAYHSVYKSGDDLRCEVQCKTMLHDGWATKMHDLTYKPVGLLDGRLALLMQTFGDSLELLENQSVSIRNLIEERWKVELKRRHTARQQLVDWVKDTKKTKDRSPGFRRIINEITNDARITSAAVTDSVIERYKSEVSELEDLKERWELAAYLASRRPGPDLAHFLEMHVDRMLAAALDAIQRGETADHVIAAPESVIACGDLDLTIAYYEKIIAQFNRYKINANRLGQLQFNYANALIERQYYEPPDEHERLRALQLVDQLIAKGVASKSIKSTPGAIDDTRGFKTIAFATNPDQVHEGIALCEKARPRKRSDFPLAWDYVDLHVRLGWRRLFEIDRPQLPGA
jgi:ppGpp synthetase/RelA/SpoT-type nucleotidyltranferase